MFKEQIIQFNGDYALTNKGRIFLRLSGTQTFKAIWQEVELPTFKEEKTNEIPKGKSTFIEPITKKEGWEKLQLKDL